MITYKETLEISLELEKAFCGCENSGEDDAIKYIIELLADYFERKKVKNFSKKFFIELTVLTIKDKDVLKLRDELVREYKKKNRLSPYRQ